MQYFKYEHVYLYILHAERHSYNSQILNLSTKILIYKY